VGEDVRIGVTNKILKAAAGLAMLGVVLWDVPVVAKAIKWLFGAAAGFDFVYERYRDPSWIGAALQMALNPPPGTALLVTTVCLALIYWSTKPKVVRMSLPVLGMLLSVISLAGFTVWYLAKNQEPKTEHAANSNAETAQRMDHAEKELVVKASELAATRQALEATRRELADARRSSSQLPRPPFSVTRTIETLSQEERDSLSRDLYKLKPVLPIIWISESGVQPPSHDRSVFVSIISKAGIQPGTTHQDLEGPDQEGLLLCVPDVDSVPDKVKKLAEVFKHYGIETRYAPLVQSRISSTVPPELGFILFVGPKPS
jgi:hypothetical protein